jgi:hypothetical protein
MRAKVPEALFMSGSSKRMVRGALGALLARSEDRWTTRTRFLSGDWAAVATSLGMRPAVKMWGAR